MSNTILDASTGFIRRVEFPCPYMSKGKNTEVIDVGEQNREPLSPAAPTLVESKPEFRSLVNSTEAQQEDSLSRNAVELLRPVFNDNFTGPYSKMENIADLARMISDYAREIDRMIKIWSSKFGVQGIQNAIVRIRLSLSWMKYWIQSSKMVWTAGTFDPTKPTLTKFLHLNSFPLIGSASLAWTNTFHAKEDLSFNIVFTHANRLRCERFGSGTNLISGELNTMRKSLASHLPHENPQYSRKTLLVFNSHHVKEYYTLFLSTLKKMIKILTNGRLLKGRKEEWGTARAPSCFPRIGQLFDGEHVWVVTQTMVFIEISALLARHTMLAYKVYPGFWGRIMLPDATRVHLK